MQPSYLDQINQSDLPTFFELDPAESLGLWEPRCLATRRERKTTTARPPSPPATFVRIPLRNHLTRPTLSRFDPTTIQARPAPGWHRCGAGCCTRSTTMAVCVYVTWLGLARELSQLRMTKSGRLGAGRGCTRVFNHPHDPGATA